MATDVTIQSNYAGREAGEIFREKILEADTLRLDLVKVYENVNNKLNMQLLETTNGTRDYSCISDGGFTALADGTVKLSEKVLEPVKLMDLFQICKEEFRTQWSEPTMGASASNPNLPRTIQEAILADRLERKKQETDNMIWNGNSSLGGQWDGFVKLFEADSDVIKANNGIVPLGEAINEDNVFDEVKKAIKALPIKMRRTNLRILVSPDVFQEYGHFLITKGALNDGNTDEKQLKFGRYQLTEVNALEDNTILIYDRDNLAFGTGLLGDHNDIGLVDEDEIGLLTGNVRGKMVYNGGVQYAYGSEIVYYKSTETPVAE